MSQETLKMSRKERSRIDIMCRYGRGEILLKEAAWEMNVCIRQAIRIKERFRAQAAEGLVHRSRDMPSNRGYSPEFRAEVLDIYEEHYRDYGPTLACETLAKHHNIEVNRETLRRWLIAKCLWHVGAEGHVHREKRERRERFGDMLQIDGSEHAWFEDRAGKSTLMVLIDDAKGEVMLYMAPAESTAAALEVLRKWVAKHGVPHSIYADRRTVYFTEDFVHNRDRRDDPETFTRFMRVTERLGIKMIPAYSPQAKGRVERINGVLQDRLVKELRRLKIDTIDEANAMLDAFAEDLNRRFAKKPARPDDAHRHAPRDQEQWDYCFCYEETRTVHKDNTVVCKNQQWQIVDQEGGPRPGQRATLRMPISGTTPYWLFGEKRIETRYIGTVRKRTARGPAPEPPGFIALEFRDKGSESGGEPSGSEPTRPSPNPAVALGSLPSVALSSRQVKTG